MKLDTIIAERKHKTIYRDGDLVAKVFDESFPKSDILNEALNQARVEETGLNIPNPEQKMSASQAHQGQNAGQDQSGGSGRHHAL